MASRKQRIALIGFGTVAQGFCQILRGKQQYLLQQYGLDFEIIAVATRTRGIMFAPEGLDLQALLDLAQTNTAFTEHLVAWDVDTLIRKIPADIVVELTPTDLKTAQPALNYCRAALETGKHLILGNKGPVAQAYAELQILAQQNQLFLLYEATVLSGTPVFSFLRSALAGNQIFKLRGILNGSTNFILSELEADATYVQAVEVAQNMGYLEADPQADLAGYDARAKVCILANYLFGPTLNFDDIPCQGITEITPADIQAAVSEQKRWKLVATLQHQNGRINARVQPEELPFTDPLSQIMGTGNALTYSTDLLGDVTLTGPGAGSRETGYAILSDLLTINTGQSS